MYFHIILFKEGVIYDLLTNAGDVEGTQFP